MHWNQFFISLLVIALQSPPVTSIPSKWRRQANAPVIGENFADPTVIHDGEFWYAFATCNSDQSIHIQMARSRDFETWERVAGDALSGLPGWVHLPSPYVWAPSVTRLGDGTFIMYYSATVVSDPRFHCVGVARSSVVTGPYAPEPDPWECQLDQGGAIDAYGFHDNSGERYVVYKIDGNALGSGGSCNNGIEPIQATPIMLQAVADDGSTKRGEAVQIFDRIGEDGPLVEAPCIRHGSDGSYILFYSSGCFSDTNYNVRWASANDVRGPYTRAGTLLESGMSGLTAPGGAEVTEEGRMLFHAHHGNGRALYTARIVDEDGIVKLVD